MISIKHRGNFDNTEKFLKSAQMVKINSILKPYGLRGVQALKEATPQDSGETANSWSYEIQVNKSSISLIWHNTNIVDGVPIAILIQYGHGTRNGGYVEGRDYINPALQSIFDKLSEEVWREVTSK